MYLYAIKFHQISYKHNINQEAIKKTFINIMKDISIDRENECPKVIKKIEKKPIQIFNLEKRIIDQENIKLVNKFKNDLARRILGHSN